MGEKISSGSAVFDKLLEGGIETDTITTIYGPGGSGKTCFGIMAGIYQAKLEKKIIYIDTEGGFSIERLGQLIDKKNILDNFIFLHPTTFEEQKKAFTQLREMVNHNIGLIIVDTISMLYRAELGQLKEGKDAFDVNRDLGVQVCFLNEIARKKNIPIIIANQVYSDFDERDKVKMVGGDILKYTSKCLIEIVKLKDTNRIAVLRKHRSQPEGKKIYFKIVQEGFEEIMQ